MKSPVVQAQLLEELEHDVYAAQRNLELTQLWSLPWPVLQQ